MDGHVAEYLIVDVAVQLLQKFRGTQLGVHLQEHQSNLTLRGEAVSYVQARCFQT